MTELATGIAAAGAAGAAGHLLVTGPHRLRPRGRSSVARHAAAVVAAAAGGAVVFLEGTRVVLALVTLAAAVAVAHDVRRRARAAEAEQRADLVLMACEGLASDLQAGQPPVAALAAVAEDWPELEPVAAAAELGADVPAALHALAGRPGAAQLRTVAAAWQVAHRSGAGLAAALRLAAHRLRDERATARVVATELAAAQATARLLILLPVGVLLLGSGLGGDPIGFLLDTTAGLVCLVTGLALAYAGLTWLARIGDHVTGRAR